MDRSTVTQLKIYVTPALSDPDAPSEVSPIDLPHIDVDVNDADGLAAIIRSGLTKMFSSSSLAEMFMERGVYIAFPQTIPTFRIPLHSVQHYAQTPLYGVTGAGRLVIGGLDLDHFTIGDLRRGSEAGYLPEPWNAIVVTQPHGLGGGGPDLATELTYFLEGIGGTFVANGVAVLWRRTTGRLSRNRQQERLKSLAAEWTGNGITEPYDLRAWIDGSPRWPTAEVGHRLGLTKKQSTQLLTALGYEYYPELHVWTLGTSVGARAQRKDWLRRESPSA